MIRRSFRRGLAFGLAGGAVMTALKALQARREKPGEKPSPAGPAEWPPIPQAAPMKVPEPAADVAVAPGPEPQPARGSGATPPPPHAAPPVSRPAEPVAPTAAKQAPAEPAASKSTKKAAKKVTKGASKSTGPAPWIEPVQGECPASHPVKAKLSSKIFHLPGGLNYGRTRPDRCYVDASTAEGDGLRAAKR